MLVHMIILCLSPQETSQRLTIKTQSSAKQKILFNRSFLESKMTTIYPRYSRLANSFPVQSFLKPCKTISPCAWEVLTPSPSLTFFPLPFITKTQPSPNKTILNGYISGLKLSNNSIFLTVTFGKIFQYHNDFYTHQIYCYMIL